MRVIRRGYRVVYEPRALLYEDALADADDEFRMRVRVGLRAFHALKDKAAQQVQIRASIDRVQNKIPDKQAGQNSGEPDDT